MGLIRGRARVMIVCGQVTEVHNAHIAQHFLGEQWPRNTAFCQRHKGLEQRTGGYRCVNRLEIVDHEHLPRLVVAREGRFFKRRLFRRALVSDANISAQGLALGIQFG